MNRRDIELLSSYLDGQLKSSELARLERRLSSEPDLRAVLDDLRSARGLLRQLPMRRAPRNFTLTPQMVGKNPPLPRTYPAFRFVGALATLLFFFTMGVNYLVPQMAQGPALGMGGGGAPEILQAAPATEPAAEEPAVGPAALLTPTPSSELAPMPTVVAPAVEDTARAQEKDLPAQGGLAPGGRDGYARGLEEPSPVPVAWVVVLAGIALLSALVMLLMRRLAAERWRQK